MLLKTERSGKYSITTPVKIDGVNVWVTQGQLASVFDVSIPAISMAIDDLTKDADIDTDSTIKQILIVALDGKNAKFAITEI